MDYNALAKALFGLKEWELIREAMLDEIDNLDTVTDIDCDKCNVAVEVRARQHASTILKDFIDKLTYKEEEKVIDKDKVARIKAGLDTD